MNSEYPTDYQAVMPSPIPGVPCLGVKLNRDGRVAGIDFLPRSRPAFTTRHASAAVAALQGYLEAEPPPQPVALFLPGTPFQRSVWEALQQLPFGSVCRYGELARRLNSSARAVAGACRANPVPLLVPCHRVVAARGLGGYLGETGGEALAIKQWLLQHEGHV